MNQRAHYEASCIIQKAQIDVKDRGLLARRDAAVATAELQVLEDALDEDDNASMNVLLGNNTWTITLVIRIFVLVNK